MANLREEARGRECQIRIPGICNSDIETVVLTHYRLAGTCGTGIKPSDAQAAWGCSACHNECDRRTRFIDRETVRLYHAEGVMRTQAVLRQEGKL
ncbi:MULTISPECIES: DUF1364 domain-containing protein [Yersinia pseudotuberculosis complex]|uniref:82 prophage-derived uncharacterized protein ybcO n=1 Tax=Yersinia similis TaxID=367190 RepID=A0A0T9PTM7_9GAMM|nr:MULTISPECIES: DUF1364 domain-containing protein [Yersinia pseudotuberculosis complex]AJK16725.1 hypothetical protein BZ19_1186 [Yersinia pseudotuberculosis str. PA3606]MCE4113758.1 DUF1364 domain-containing protein [Yersinia pseudotuberculosis]MCF1165052.1 DUF1364 domain-containing protein [Yersinia pseudotuberculosis]RYC28129.1 DUF1364 domain-containing protein [Yersinia pseudotuberculosis]UFA61916.1 DUF1364 domain-containing protein [Yersinia pseudotuberculosis]